MNGVVYGLRTLHGDLVQAPRAAAYLTMAVIHLAFGPLALLGGNGLVGLVSLLTGLVWMDMADKGLEGDP